MTQYIADEAHFKEVIARVPNVKRSLWIGTAPCGLDIEGQGSAPHPCQGTRPELP